MVKIVQANIFNVFDMHAPYVIVSTAAERRRSPWITDNIKYLQSLRDAALRKFKRTRLPEHWDYYQQLRNYTTTAIKAEKKAYLEFRVTHAGGRTMWRELRNLNVYSSKQFTIPSDLRNANMLNTHFSQVSARAGSVDDVALLFYSSKSRPGVDTFEFEQVTEDLVAGVINGITSNSIGVDGISRKMILLCCPFLIPYITYIFNFCLHYGVYPTALKEARVMPIPKIANPSESGDMRPISILSVLSGALERIMSRQLSGHLQGFHILPSTQSGFRSGYSCATALTKITDDIITSTDKGYVTILTLLDFSKAFDTLNHSMMLAVLHYIGLGPLSLKLFENYLYRRKQRVVLDADVSGAAELVSGVPQGSALGPLLYTIYTSQMLFFGNLSSNFHMYADDTQMYKSFSMSDVQVSLDGINRDLESFGAIAGRHGLSLNKAKSSFMVFGGRRNTQLVKDSIHLYMGNEELKQTECAKNLGVLIDQNLNFSKHISQCIRKAYGALKITYSSRHILSVPIKRLLADSLVLSHFDYCDTVYGPCLLSSDIRRVQVVQNACMRFIFGISRRQRISHKLKERGWFEMKKRQVFHFYCFNYTILKN